eukprot:SAG11_NODE_38485_length_252_cov_0.673203_1_plen_42_part_10
MWIANSLKTAIRVEDTPERPSDNADKLRLTANIRHRVHVHHR